MSISTKTVELIKSLKKRTKMIEYIEYIMIVLSFIKKTKFGSSFSSFFLKKYFTNYYNA